jgi:hypothetical protein
MKNLERFEAMQKEIESLGNDNNYNGQAQAFIAGTETTIAGRFLGMEGGHFGKDDEARDVWEIKIERNGRAFTFKYGKSIAETEERLEKIAGHSSYGSAYEGAYLRRNPERIVDSLGMKIRMGKWEKEAREWVRLDSRIAVERFAPSAYSVLASVEKYEPSKDIDDFASEYGIEKVSEAVRIHKAVTEQYQEMRALFDNDELEALALIS